ncbi:hypothetical protein BP5796_01927 [Coleophoma crateriformis]|uniref:S-adenosyl-L-methionine-dependent methyltransferase n=1 Tax=Coleophoma crateriformis TaxID=565419 RepID=A0A3D8T1U1_9HELO|nr:hypothetical protein BP5796_01927 [Coleophoma crateriformis]
MLDKPDPPPADPPLASPSPPSSFDGSRSRQEVGPCTHQHSSLHQEQTTAPPSTIAPPDDEPRLDTSDGFDSAGVEEQVVPDFDSLIDLDDFRDYDSALGDEDDLSSTQSIMSSIMRFREENGRTYNGYGNRTYVLPNDEPEMDRLDFQHHLLGLTFDHQLTVCPIGRVHRVLDIGTGTGIWAIDFAEEHPETTVIGIDVSPIQPSFVPPNCIFEIDDLEKPWNFTYKFDFIHSRMMTGSFQDWPRFVQQCYENLEPGGYIEMIDVSFPNRSDDHTLSPDSALQKWGNYMLEASINLGCPLNTAETYRGLLQDQGFIDIEEKVYKWPQNRWPADKKHKEIGLWTMENFTSNLSGLSVALFTRGLGWSTTDLEVFLVDVRREMKSMKIHSYWPIYVVYAQKPMN